MSHPSRVRELKLVSKDKDGLPEPSHPSRVRELKLKLPILNLLIQLSHPSRVRELKQDWEFKNIKPLEVAPLPGA